MPTPPPWRTLCRRLSLLPVEVTLLAASCCGVGWSASLAGASGAFELNVMLPVMARNILESATLLATTSRLLADRCVSGITADRERARELAEGSPSIVTPLNRYIGYEAAAAVAKQSIAERRPIRDIVVERGHVASGEITQEQLDEALDVLRMTRPPASGGR